jgi:hypothetical protein
VADRAGAGAGRAMLRRRCARPARDPWACAAYASGQSVDRRPSGARNEYPVIFKKRMESKQLGGAISTPARLAFGWRWA